MSASLVGSEMCIRDRACTQSSVRIFSTSSSATTKTLIVALQTGRAYTERVDMHRAVEIHRRGKCLRV
eukprot:8020139-Alexandrium_andersonii.AAC.1